MNKICTTIEQSRKLIKLGIDINTVDMYYSYDYNIDEYEDDAQIIPQSELGQHFSLFPEDISAWSLAALLSLMPFHYIENNSRFGFYQVKSLNKQGETYRFGYKTNNDFFLFETSWYNDVIDAAFEMVIWLKENGKI